jgi:heme exporter protein C
MKKSSTTTMVNHTGGIKKSWWKIATVVLLLYSLVAGLFIPLIPSVTSVSPSKIADHQTIRIEVYNGQLQTSDNIRVWTTDLNTCWESTTVKVKSSQQVDAHFTQGPYFESKNLHLVVETKSFRDTLFNAVYYTVTDTTAQGVLRIEKIQPKVISDAPFGFPNREILNETIRFLFFHVPFWFAMMTVCFVGLFFGIRFLSTNQMHFDIYSEKFIKTGILMGILGLISGSIWARFTWGTWWTFDVKLNGAALTVLIYVAYLVLRSGITDEIQKARISAVYSIFAFVLMIVFVMVVPRIYDSLHPGNGGNAPVSDYDFDSTLRMVFYPAVVAWIGIAVWISQLNIRFQKLKNKKDETV